MATKKKEGAILQCSFCNRSQDEVRKLIVGPNVYICDACVDICLDIMADERSTERRKARQDAASASPELVRMALDPLIVGQGKAKDVLAKVLVRHSQRGATKEGTVASPVHVLLMGPSGTGKTALARGLADILTLPVARADATRLAGQSYFPQQNLMSDLVASAHGDKALAGRGIVILDQVDHLAVRGASDDQRRQRQAMLLEVLSGQEIPVVTEKEKQSVVVNTQGVLCVAFGAFDGLADIVQRRLRGTAGATRLQESLLNQVTDEDLVEFGLLPALVTRFGIRCAFDTLQESEYSHLLERDQKGLLKEYQGLFAEEGLTVKFDDSALSAIVQAAMRRQGGVRALRAVLEMVALHVSSETTGRTGTTEYVIDAGCVERSLS